MNSRKRETRITIAVFTVMALYLVVAGGGIVWVRGQMMARAEAVSKQRKTGAVIKAILEKKHKDGKARVIGVTPDGTKVYAVEGIHYGQHKETEK